MYSDSRIINTAVVEEVAKKTIQHITEQNPNVKLDTSLLPGNIFSVATSGLAAGATVISVRLDTNIMMERVLYFMHSIFFS